MSDERYDHVAAMDKVFFDPVPEVIFQSVLVKELVSGKRSPFIVNSIALRS